MTTFQKDTTAILDYSVDWTDWLNGDTIASSSWSAGGLTSVASSFVGAIATLWVSNGSVNADYTIRNTIVTVGGRTDVRSILIQVRVT